MGSIGVIFVRSLGALAGATSHVARHTTGLLTNVYDVYVAIPLRIESMIAGGRETEMKSRGAPGAAGRKNVSTGSQPTEGLA
jgi:hypothetical protein